eukprot:11157580-Lingulodinium_polyedra.AAC.1
MRALFGGLGGEKRGEVPAAKPPGTDATPIFRKGSGSKERRSTGCRAKGAQDAHSLLTSKAQ